MPLSMGEQSGNGATAVTVWLCVLEAAFNNMKTHMSRFWGKSQLHTSRMEDESSDRFPECFTRFLCLDSHYVQNDFHFSWRVDGVTRRHCSTVTCWQVWGAYSTCCCALRLEDLVAGGSAWTDTFARYTCRTLPSWTYIHFRCMTFLLYNASAFQRVLL